MSFNGYPFVEVYKYLGILITDTFSSKLEIEAKDRKVKQAFEKLDKIVPRI